MYIYKCNKSVGTSVIFLAKEKLNMFLPRDPEKTLGELQTEEKKRVLGKSAAASWLCCPNRRHGEFFHRQLDAVQLQAAGGGGGLT